MAGPAMLVAAAVLAVLVAAGTTALLRPDSLTDGLVTGGTIVAVEITATMLAAGLAGALRPAPVVALHGLQAAVVLAVVARSGLLRTPVPAFHGLRLRTCLRLAWPIALMLLAGGALAWQLLIAMVLPPFAYDALTYHLTTVATWVQRGDVAPTPLSLCCAHYPAGPELLFAWPAVLLGSDALVGTVQIAAALLGGAAVAGLARTSALSRGGAAAAGALFVTTPIVLAQAPTAYVDVVLGAMVLVALHALARYASTADARRLVVTGLATGTVLGTKGVGALWAVVLMVVVIAVATGHVRLGRIAVGPAVVGSAAVIGTSVALSGWWYLRNLVQTGNPVYPFAIEVGGVRLLDGPVRLRDVVQPPPVATDPWPVAVLRSWAADLDFWNQSYDYQQRLGGLGPVWLWLGLPLLPLFVIHLARARRAMLLVPVVVVVVFLVQPFRWWSRFTLPLAALGALAVVAATEWARRRWWRWVLRTAAVSLAVAGVALVSDSVDPAARSEPLSATRVLGLIGAPPADRTLGRLFHPEYAFLVRVPADATVLVDLAATPVRFVSPLFGAHYTRTVLPASVNVPPGAWVVTAPGREVDRAMAGDGRFTLDSDLRDVRVWRPVAAPRG